MSSVFFPRPSFMFFDAGAPTFCVSAVFSFEKYFFSLTQFFFLWPNFFFFDPIFFLWPNFFFLLKKKIFVFWKNFFFVFWKKIFLSFEKTICNTEPWLVGFFLRAGLFAAFEHVIFFLRQKLFHLLSGSSPSFLLPHSGMNAVESVCSRFSLPSLASSSVSLESQRAQQPVARQKMWNAVCVGNGRKKTQNDSVLYRLRFHSSHCTQNF